MFNVKMVSIDMNRFHVGMSSIGSLLAFIRQDLISVSYNRLVWANIRLVLP